MSEQLNEDMKTVAPVDVGGILEESFGMVQAYGGGAPRELKERVRCQIDELVYLMTEAICQGMIDEGTDPGYGEKSLRSEIMRLVRRRWNTDTVMSSFTQLEIDARSAANELLLPKQPQ